MMIATASPMIACPITKRNPYIVENQCGSRDIAQSIAAKLTVTT
jgi:hypothetical protein